MFKNLLLAFIMMSSSFAGVTEKLAELGEKYIEYRSRYFPVWATSVGIFDYDSLLTDYSSEAVFAYRNNISKILQNLRRMKPNKMSADNYIDYQLLMANIKYDEFILAKFSYHEHSPAVYVDDALNSLYYILIDNSRTPEEKSPFLLKRLKAIPVFLEQKWAYQPYMDKVFYEVAIESAGEGTKLIEEVAQMLYKAMPDSIKRAARYKMGAIDALKNYKRFCKIEMKDANEKHFIGKNQFNYLLKNIHFLNIDSDSLKKIGWYWYNKSNDAIDSLQQITNNKILESDNVFPVPDSLTEKDILEYYQWEIDQTADFFRQNDILTIPDEIGDCIPAEMPEFMRAIRKGIAYQPPAPFSADQTGYFYVRPIPTLDSTAVLEYSKMIRNRGFKGSAVHEAYPGHHLQLSIANQHPSKIRRIQQNTMFTEGWALYCEEMATREGLFKNDDLVERWKGVYGGIRFRAVRVIVDCSLADSTMTPDSALVFMNKMLGDNTEYFTAEIRRYCSYPTQALSYLTGKLYIMDMLGQSREKEGKSFSLKKFHDSILAEGTIPPALISEKLGYINK